MRRSRFRKDEMVKILREADRIPVAEVAKKHGVATQTISIWRERFGKLDPADVNRRDSDFDQSGLPHVEAEDVDTMHGRFVTPRATLTMEMPPSWFSGRLRRPVPSSKHQANGSDRGTGALNDGDRR